MDANNQYIESRSNAIESIESTLHELGGIFQQLAQMVSEQRDMVQRYKSLNLKPKTRRGSQRKSNSDSHSFAFLLLILST